MNLRYHIAPLLAFGLKTGARIFGSHATRFQIVILHDVSERDFGALGHFLEMVEREHGFLNPADIDDWLSPTSATGANTRLRSPCLLSFDDGFASALPIARDILPRFDISAVFFVCPGLIELPARERDGAVMRQIFRGIPPEQGVPSLMGWDELAELRRAGHIVGAHGMNHIKLSNASLAECEAEILTAGDYLEKRLGQKTDWYAYAFGDINSISAPALQIVRSRYRYCRSGIRGSNGADNIPGVLTAQEINLSTPEKFQCAILDGALDPGYVWARRQLRSYAQARPISPQYHLD